eukprot:315302-Amphidinium_carterae.1
MFVAKERGGGGGGGGSGGRDFGFKRDGGRDGERGGAFASSRCRRPFKCVWHSSAACSPPTPHTVNVLPCTKGTVEAVVTSQGECR